MSNMTNPRNKVGANRRVSRARASRDVDPSLVRSGKDDDVENDVLPNLLLDVREGFLGAFRSVFREFGITDQQYRVLSILHRKGDLEISKLARHARIAAPSMTGILDRMTEIGWLTRKVPKGQRWGVVGLTAAGRKLIVQVQPMTARRFASFEAALGLNKLGQLGELLVKARAVLRELVASDPRASKAAKNKVPRKRKISKRPAARPKDRRTLG
jgi:homoprotocatechuate degradation regulator HpaR